MCYFEGTLNIHPPFVASVAVLITNIHRSSAMKKNVVLIAFAERNKVLLMLAKARKSIFNANTGEFCSVTFVCLFVCLFLWRLKLRGYISNSSICD